MTPPNLKFHSKQGTETTSDPRSIFRFGPYSGNKDIRIVGVYAPPYLRPDQIETFVNDLRSAYKRHGFGNLEFQGRNVFRYSQDIDEKRIDRIVELCPAVTTKNSIVLAILPDRRTGFYIPLKDRFFKARRIPIQVIMESTFRRILGGDYGPIKGLIIQIYTKLLGKKEALWILEDPADDNRGTVYIGIGFSATPLEGKKANSFAALCDAKGREIDWKPIGAPFKGRYIDDEWFRGFLDFVAENLRPNTGRIVVFRKGDTYESEVAIMQKIIDQSKPFFAKNFHFVSVINETRRIYAYETDWTNPEPGVFVVLNDKEAILASSSHHELVLKQGTVVPVRIVVSIGSDNVSRIVSEYRALTYLNWTSPVTISKYPLVLNVANRIAELVKERLDEELLSTFFPS
jgi:argonaute-like protein implicated in RNA metabolism and viral defense